MLLNTITTYEVAKTKNKDKWGCYAQEQRQMMLQSTRTTTNEVAKHKNNDKWGW